ncbi:hypothetical protein QJQ45_029894, partial [Haematococcus lacustris]
MSCESASTLIAGRISNGLMAGSKRLNLCIAVAVLNACRLGTTAYALEAIAKRCEGTIGDWCGRFDRQKWLITRPVPRGRQPCPSTKHGVCSGVGNCNYDTGLCDCPAGWQGVSCNEPLKRPCTNRFRDSGLEVVGHIDEEGMDLDPLADGFTESRCIGICDATIAACYCDGPRFGRVNPPKGSPPATPPLRRGRPLGNHLCQPSDDGKGNALPWGQVPWDDLYGPEGWCMADNPKFTCPCMYDGLDGQLCDKVIEMYCPNSCSGHGVCDLGFCKCNQGWYGADCVRKNADMDMFEAALVGSPLGKAAPTAKAPPVHAAVRAWESLQARVHRQPGAVHASIAQRATEHLAKAHRLRRMRPHTRATAPMVAYGKEEAEVRPAESDSTTGLADGAEGGAGGAMSGPQGPHHLLLTHRPRPLIYVYDLPSAYNARMLQYRVDKMQCVWRAYGSGNTTLLANTLYGLEPLLHELMLQSEHRTFDPEEADYFYMPIYSSCFIYPIHCWADGPWWHSPSGPRVMHVTNMLLEARDWVRSHFPWWNRRGGRDHIFLMTHDEGACYAPTEIFNSSIFLTHWGRLDLRHRSNTAFTPDNYTQEYVYSNQPNGWLRTIQGHPCYDPVKDLVLPSLKYPHQFHASPLLVAPRQSRNITLFFRQVQLPPGQATQPTRRLHESQVHVVFEPLLDWAAFSVRVAEDQLDKQDVHKLLQAGLAQQLSRLPKAEAEQGTEAGSGAEAGKVGLGRSLHAGGGSREGSLQGSVDGVWLAGGGGTGAGGGEEEGRKEVSQGAEKTRKGNGRDDGWVDEEWREEGEEEEEEDEKEKGVELDMWFEEEEAELEGHVEWFSRGEEEEREGVQKGKAYLSRSSPPGISVRGTPWEGPSQRQQQQQPQQELDCRPGGTGAASSMPAQLPGDGQPHRGPGKAVGAGGHERHTRFGRSLSQQQDTGQGSKRQGKREQLIARQRVGFRHEDDAFGTLMQWLYFRLPYTRQRRPTLLPMQDISCLSPPPAPPSPRSPPCTAPSHCCRWHAARHLPCSRGIRQRLYALAQQQQWATKHAIFIGEPNDIPGDYSQLLARSRFCLVAPGGDGWSSRAEDAVLHGCIPLVVMDQVHVVFEPLLDWAAFSVRVAEDQLDKAGLAQQLSRLPKAEAEQGTEAGSGAEAGKVGLGRSLHAGGGSREGSLQSSVDGVWLAEGGGTGAGGGEEEGRKEVSQGAEKTRKGNGRDDGWVDEEWREEGEEEEEEKEKGVELDMWFEEEEAELEGHVEWFSRGEEEEREGVQKGKAYLSRSSPPGISVRGTPWEGPSQRQQQQQPQQELDCRPGGTGAASSMPAQLPGDGQPHRGPGKAVGAGGHERHTRFGRSLSQQQDTGLGSKRQGKREQLIARQRVGFRHEDDAFGTLMQWLYFRLPYT